jgi:hypothetical protein
MRLVLLTGIFYTHMWIGGKNLFVKICQYETNHRIWVYDWQSCPANRNIKISGEKDGR